MKRTRHLITAIATICFTAATTMVQAQVDPPPNDHCGDVIPSALAAGSTIVFTGNNEGATVDGDNAPGSVLDGFGIPVVWLAFTTTTCADVAISFCGSTAPFLSNYFWEVITMQCPADELVYPAGYNNNECADGQPVIHFNELAAGTYYYPVWSNPGDAIGEYVISISATACASAGPANDLCSGAQPHSVDIGGTVTIEGDNTGATDTENFGRPVVWESFTIPQCANVTVDYCGTNPVFTDFAFGIYGECPATMVIENTSADLCVDGNMSETFVGLAPGTYWIPVVMDVNGAEGMYAIQVMAEACAGPSNNYCNGAELHDLAVGDTLVINGNNTGATDNEGLGYAGVWESFTISECADVEVSYCGTDTQFNVAAIPGIYAECPVTELIMPSSLDACDDGNLIANFEGLAAGTYWIPVAMVPDVAEGAYVLNVSATACPVVITPANDRCEDVTTNVLVLGDPLAITGDNTGATDSEGLGFANVWESITIAECASVTLDYCGTDNTFSVFATGIYADCPATQLIQPSSTDTCASGNPVQTFVELAAGTYWIPVLMTPDSAEGVYTINVTAVACEAVAPANDLCADAASITVVAPDSCATGVVVGYNLNATGSGDMPTCADPAQGWQDVWYTFNTGGADEATISLVPGTIVGAGMEVFAACGDSSLACSIDGSQIELNQLTDSIYHVRVFTQDDGTPGTFALCVTSDNTTGVSSMDRGTVHLYPNPGTGDFTFVPSVSWTNARITVLDMTGRTVHVAQADLKAGEAYPLFLAGELKAGSYLFHVTSAEGSSMVKLMVK